MRESRESYPGRSHRPPVGLFLLRDRERGGEKSAEGIVGRRSGETSEALHVERRSERIGQAAKALLKART